MTDTTLGMLLRQRRLRAKLSQVRLARHARLSEATIKFIESDKHHPTKKTRMKLLAVSPLALTHEELGLHPPFIQIPKPSPGAVPFVAALLLYRIHKRIARIQRRRINPEE